MGEQVGQFLVIILQALGIALMELPVIGVHDVVFRRVFLPHFCRLHSMEPCGVFLEEGLHLGNLQDAFIVVLHIVVPDTGTAFFHGLGDRVHVNNVVADLGHQLHEDNLVDAWEDLSLHQIGHLQLHEPLRELQLIFHVCRDLIYVLGILAVHPVGHEVIAIRLMRGRDEHLQTAKELLPHRSGGCRQENMRGQLGEVGIHVLVSDALCHHAPECLVDAVVHELLIDRIAVLQKPCLQHGLDDGVRLGVLQACQCRHDGHLQLGRRSRSDRLSGHLVPTGLRIEELPVLLEAAPERRRLGDAHLVHPHGDQISTEFLTVQLHVQQPVILVGLVGEGTVHQIVAGGIVHGQQLLHIEVVGAGERDDLGPAQRDLVQLVHELLILVDPDDNPALIELRQRCRKPTI